jgi:hypothetical protein
MQVRRNKLLLMQMVHHVNSTYCGCWYILVNGTMMSTVIKIKYFAPGFNKSLESEKSDAF